MSAFYGMWIISSVKLLKKEKRVVVVGFVGKMAGLESQGPECQHPGWCLWEDLEQITVLWSLSFLVCNGGNNTYLADCSESSVR